ncbi:N-acetyltransferase [Paenibacillus sp. 1781tsa1]|uniref:GNAT family N-acetyltransferase n=1 Tax=Paenibacillus sp. 1781tsa1 TaxID=2953810 RepID=UPI00209D88D2|nr:GNAT family N-acetyltransferase [Paenibacillus sp. 1781tsa1]MCP1185108.1 GNAT family N-acetyltransferase [Paenibacillus sp. 1781tsa1]
MSLELEFDYISEEYMDKVMRFDCGKDAVNEFLQEHALELHRCNFCITKLFFKDDEIVGFISTRLGEVAVHSRHIDRLGLTGTLPTNPYYRNQKYPIVHIQFLGVDKRYKRTGIARDAVNRVLGMAIDLIENIGCNFVYLESYLDEEPLHFYKSLGFYEVERDEDLGVAKMIFSVPPQYVEYD